MRTEAPFRITTLPVPPPPPPENVQLTVLSVDAGGSPLPGYYTTLSQGGVQIDAQFTPATFDLQVGQSYEVGPQDFGDYVFQRWSDGALTRPRPVVPISTAPISLTAVYASTSLPPPPPPPATMPITSVVIKYWHYITAGNTNNIYAEIGYTTSQIIPMLRAMMIARDSAGVVVDRFARDLPGQLSDNVAMYRNIPASFPTNLNLEFYFADAANPATRLSPIVPLSASLNTFSNTYRPLEAPTLSQPVKVRVIYRHYIQLLSGAWQAANIATYATHSSLVGQAVRGRMTIGEPGAAQPYRTTTYSTAIPAQANGVILMKAGTAPVDPPAVETGTMMIDAAGAVISNVAINQIQQGRIWP